MQIRSLNRVVNVCSKIAESTAAIFLWMIFLVLLGELLSRNLLSRSLAGSWEMAAFMMAAMFFLGLAPALVSESHVRVTMLSGRLSGRLAWLVEAVVLTVAFAVSSYGATALINLAITSLQRGSRSWELSIPLAVPQAFVALGMTLFAFTFAAKIILLLFDSNELSKEDHG
ncbi:TRAP-type C4-dicarboxylate transport system permease small subunit [Loktanella ponticola]|uniref:TRAP transporter small permease protein n=1 Tax=Yoonia ponticola TaxID=1524255 RepID=A0A7W9BP23_9RHOB|nr:TRAP transporter small permease [Yoonia ponticola]MBB5724063.1 TRAP-type C4-dicarboxylate transport system permease small subunit [Yoonia ponticola]